MEKFPVPLIIKPEIGVDKEIGGIEETGVNEETPVAGLVLLSDIKVNLEELDKCTNESMPQQERDLSPILSETLTCYMCDLCTEIFMDKAELKQHEQTQHEVAHPDEAQAAPMLSTDVEGKCSQQALVLSLYCPMCSTEFINQEAMSSHMQKAECQTCSLTCQYCQTSFKHFNSLHSHEKSHVTCDVCLYECDDPADLIKHKARCKSTYKRNSCSKCHKTFQRKSQLMKHVSLGDCQKSGTVEKQVRAKLEQIRQEMASKEVRRCGTRSMKAQEKRAKTTLKEYPASKSDQAEVTDAKESSGIITGPLNQQELTNNVHIDVKTFPTIDCNDIFTAKRLLKKHVESDKIIPKYTCEKCGQCFYSRRGLRYHLKQRKGKLCKYCIKSFESLCAMSVHLKSHPEAKRKIQECPLCGKEYSSWIGMKYHMQWHQNRYKFKCDVCGRRFLRKFMLEKHNIIHSDNQQKIKCETCDKEFLSMDSLRMHQKNRWCSVKTFKNKHFIQRTQHTSRNIITEATVNHKCNLCQQSYTFYNELKEHMKSHKLTCTMCPATFLSPEVYVLHMEHCSSRNS